MDSGYRAGGDDRVEDLADLVKTNVITLEHVTYSYPASSEPALRDVSLAIPAGQFCAVVGANGAGKSTLAYTLSGFVPHFYRGSLAGRVTVAGRQTTEAPLSELVLSAGMVFQNPFNQISGTKFTVREEIAFGLENLGAPREEIRERVAMAMALVGIEALADRSPLAVSGGEMQRVAIASVLVMRPPVVILDEPTSQLDPVGSREVFGAIRALAAGGEMTVVVIEHKLEWVAHFAERVVALAGGRIIADGKPAEVLTDEKLMAHGVGHTRYTAAARQARGLGWWPKGRTLPVTLEEAVDGFRANDEKQKWVSEMQRETLFRAALRGSFSSMGIEIESLSYKYPSGVTALRDVSLQVAAGEAVAIIGQNGAGKTTLVKHLNGLLKPTHGQVRVGSWDTRERSVAQLAARVGYVFQNPDDQLFQRTVQAEVMFGPRNLGWAKNRAAAQAETTLKTVGLLEQAGRHPYDLSPGDRRLVALAAVLAMDTPVIVLDEPTTGQDYAGVEKIGRIVDDLRAKGRTLITITHDMDFCAEHFERAVVMAEGRLLLDGPSRTVFAQADVLAQSDVDPPQLARLASRLGMETVPLTVEEFIAEVGQAGKTEL